VIDVSTTQIGSGPSSGAAAPPIPFSLPWVPPGENPETYDLERVHGMLKSAAYFSIFNVANPDASNHANLLMRGLPLFITSVDVDEQLHRFETAIGWAGNDLRAAKQVGEAVARVGIQWTPIPDYYVAMPGRTPPLWLLNPFLSQRFCMLGGHLNFKDKDNSGVHAFGTGRTFPVNEGGKQRLRIAAIIEVLEGLGKLKGLQGAFCINGFIEPPNNLALNLMVRMMDPAGTLRADTPIQPLEPIADPDPDAVFVSFLGEVDPEKGVHLILSPDGKGMIGSKVSELMRLVSFSFDINGPKGLQSFTKEGPIIGNLEANLFFNPLSSARVIPIQTTEGVFTFHDPEGGVLGKVWANMIEGRAFRTQIDGFPMPLFRFVGFGPILRGTGQFEGVDGMMSMNSVVSVFPRTLSNLYIFRFYDPKGKLRSAWSDIT